MKRGLSREQVPVLVAADSGGATVSAVLPAVSAATPKGVLGPVVETDIVLVSDGAASYPPRAAHAVAPGGSPCHAAAEEARPPTSVERESPNP